MKIVITIGDCNGIGIEVLLKAILRLDRESSYANDIELFISGNQDTIENYLERMHYPAEFIANELHIGRRVCKIDETGVKTEIKPGLITKSAGILAAHSVENALTKTMDGVYDAMVTMPISKESVHLAGWRYPGHTEMLADRCGVKKPIMLLCTREIRVALATIHIPLHEVPFAITFNDLVKKASILNRSLIHDFGIEKPRIAMLGLNPHSGENGDIGNEEKEVLIPAINKIAIRGINIEGPFPADGFFAHGEYTNYDAIIAMYHDQGLIPLKLLAKGAGVNYTANLPVIRTSPDHGTAFGIAGKNIANETSAYEAIEFAYEIAKNRTVNPIQVLHTEEESDMADSK